MYYMTASSTQPGALGLFAAYGPEEELAARLDAGVVVGKARTMANPLSPNELRYGWLRSGRGEIIDEVMIARPLSGARTLMTHGGYVIREKVERYFAEQGFGRLDELPPDRRRAIAAGDELYDPLLASCVTEAQAAALLAAREKAAGEGGEPVIPEELLLTRRLILAGAPNAGKSSLLNRLARHERAFVHHEAGATTDVVDELVDLGGYAVLVGDMPGFSRDGDHLGEAAWRKAAARLRLADAVLVVVDGSRGWDAAADAAATEVAAVLKEGRADGGRPATVAVVVNKSDLPDRIVGTPWVRLFPGAPMLRVCSLDTGDALDRIAELAPMLFGDGDE